MSFNRPPRLQKRLPTDIVKIPRPRGLPSKPGDQNWLTTVLPVAAIVVMMILMVFLSGSGMGTISYLFFVPIMLVTAIGTILTNRGQKKKYQAKMAEVKAKYKAELRAISEKLKGMKADNEKISRDQNPDVQQCIQRAKNEDLRLGERRPTDSDFLSVRLGSGEDIPSFKIEPMEEDIEVEELREEVDFAKSLPQKYQTVVNVPIRVHLGETGSIGFAGNRDEALPVVRSFICHLLTHHWPTEVQVAVSTSDKDWLWLDTTPHRAKNLSNALSAKDFFNSLESLLHNREQLLESQKLVRKESGDTPRPLPVYIILIDTEGQQKKHPAIELLLDKGAKLGVLGLFITSSPKLVPSKCGAIVQISNNAVTLKQTGKEGIIKRAGADKLSLNEAQQFANYLDKIQWPDDLSTNPPELISLLDLLGYPKIEDLPIKEWWEENPNKDYLRAPIGLISPTSQFIFDINDADNAYGPHGVLGGMTGSGKSEVLKTILLALAVRHHPYDLNFALIDYKGGSAFNELEKLPHTVGVMTNIESHSSYAERIILALTGEIENREQILGQARQAFGLSRPHVDDYRKLQVKRPLPRLIIVFDEFAEFKQKHQEESRRLISIARKGRSLGIHLILATQNIPSAVDPEVLQNSSFRICLKVSEAADSMQLVGVPDAVNLPRGRAIFLSKNRTQFQVAFSGGEYAAGGGRAAVKEYVRVWPDGRKDKLMVAPDETSEENLARPTQASKIVQKIIQTAHELNLAPPPKVWPEPLNNRIYLEDLFERTLAGGWDGAGWQAARIGKAAPFESVVAPILGMYDVPSKQSQYIYQLNQAQGGDHLLIFGSAGTGRSTLLRTLIISSAMANSPEAVSFYIIDYGGQSTLSSLQDLPHVGAVATKLEKEKTERIIQFLHAEMKRRNDLFVEKKMNNWREYNRSEGEKLPVVYLLIDNFREFKNAFQMSADDFLSSLDSLISGSSAAGIFLVVTANTTSDLSPTKLADNINQKVSLYQVESDEYTNIVGRPAKSKLDEDINLGPVPGRGYLRATPPLEFQAALPLGNDSTWGGENFETILQKMAIWNGKKPQRIEKLPLLIPYSLSERDARREQIWAPVGKEYSTLETLGLSLVEDGPFFWITSQSNRQGKTSLIKGLVLALARLYSPKDLRITFIDFHGSRKFANFADLPHTDAYVAVEKQFEETLKDLNKEREDRQLELDELFEKNPKANSKDLKQKWPQLLVVIDNFGGLIKNTEALKSLELLSQNAKELGISFLLSSRLTEVSSLAYSGITLGSAIKTHGCGVLFGGSEGMDAFNNTVKPRGQPNVSGLPAGRGFLINRNQAQLMQAFTYWGEGEDMDKAEEKWINQINGAKTKSSKATAR